MRSIMEEENIVGNSFEKYLHQIALANGIFGALAPLPQIHMILTTQHAADVSVLTWMMSAICSTIWLTYGFYRKDKPIICSSILALILFSGVVISTLMVS